MAFHFVNSARLACIPHSMLLAALAGIALHTLVQPAAGLTLPPLPVVEQWVDREYVYGPDYVDEFLAQFDRDGRPMLMLQDGNFNVVALLAGADDVFFDAGTNGLPAGSVLEQYVYDPYGGVRQADSFAEHAVNRVGHQGLFFDRFDGDWEHAGLAPGAVGLYYNRNRFYSPPSLRNVGDAENPDWRLVGLGRFVSADPNETALTLVSALAMNGQSLGAPDALEFNADAHYRDGFNLYQFLRSNPFNRRDPLGLFDDFDYMIASYYGERAAYADYLYGSAMGGAMVVMRGAAVWAGIAGITAICPPLGMALTAGISAYGMYRDVNDLLENGWSWGTGASLAANAITLGSSSAALRMMGNSWAKSRSAYAGMRGAGVVSRGTKVYRVWGDKSGPYGKSWTTVDPRTVPEYRAQAGLPDTNRGRYLSEGYLDDLSGVRSTTAAPLDGNPGGLNEIIIPNPKMQVRDIRVKRMDPPF